MSLTTEQKAELFDTLRPHFDELYAGIKERVEWHEATRSKLLHDSTLASRILSAVWSSARGE